MEQRLDDTSEELEQLEEDAPEEDVEPQAPVMVRVRLNGQTVEVTEAVADAIHAREADYQRQISKMGTELGQLRKQPEKVSEQPAEFTQEDDLEFFQSPTKAVEKRLREAEERAYQRIQADNARQKAQEQYWGKFYSDNKDLAEHEEVVQFLVQKNFEELKDLTPAESQRELANKAKAFLGRPQGGKPLPKGPAHSERPSNPTPSAPKAEETPTRKYQGISAEIAAQAEKRRRALYNIRKDKD
jgi:vacuolar-type H+-ATPase subunit I/STV1